MRKTAFLSEAAIIAAVYAALTIVVPAGFGPVQCRVSEALVVLPCFTAAAIPGLTVGCLVANIVGGYGLLDIVLGSLATLIAAVASCKIRVKWLVPAPSVVANAFIVALVLNVSGGFPYWETVLTVGAGQLISCYALGLPLLYTLDRYKHNTVL